MPTIIALDEVQRIRGQIAKSHSIAAFRFRELFAAHGVVAPTAYLELLAAALLETAHGVRLPSGDRIQYAVNGQTIVPFVRPGEPLFRHFRVDRSAASLFEYWMVMSELSASPAWAVTKVIATHDEYDAALRGMTDLQMVRALVASFLPSVDWPRLEVTLYTRADEERVERRHLVIDDANELHFHSRDLIAEGKGGVRA